jgi:hypothetical protein
MSKKIIISESQYRRVFLSEQKVTPMWNRHIRMWTHPAYSDYEFNVPKNMIYKKNSDGTYSPKYPSSNMMDKDFTISKDDPDIIKQTIKLENEKQFKENITDKKSGDKFRRWVRDDSKRLSKVEKELKKNNLSGTLDASGDYDNEYIKIAWNLLGTFYLIDSRTKKEIDDEFKGWLEKNPIYDDYSQIDYTNAKRIQSDVRKSNEYQNYIKALKNRRSLKSTFGWTDDESISIQNNIEKLLSGEISSSTCINPESLLIDLRFAKESVQSYFKNNDNINVGSDVIFSSTAGGWKKGGISKYYSNFESDEDLEKEYSEYIEKSKELKRECPNPIVNKYDNVNVASSTYVDNPYKNYDSNDNQPTTYVNYNSQSEVDACTKKRNELNAKYPNIIFRWREYQKIKTQEESAKKELKSLGFEVNDTTLMDVRQINQIFYILEIINVHNLIIAGQSSQKEEQLCDDIVYGTKVEIVKKIDRSGGATVWVDTPVSKDLTFSWKNVCQNRGGVFTYPTERKLEKGNSKSIGWVGNQGYCMCARNNEDVIKGKKIYEWAEVSDTRKWYDPERIGDAVKDCATDWHCILDIVSIAAYAFGPVGAIVSGIVDAISAIGYVIEGDEGWKLNAGLTALGMFGIGEGLSLAKRGVNFSNKLNDLGSIIGKNVDNTGKIKDAFKLERDIANWTKGLTKTEKNLYKEFTKFNNKLNQSGGEEFLNQINKKIKDLPNPNKGTLEKMFKELKPEDMKKLFDESGGDLLKMTNKYSKGVRGAVIQGTIFLGMYVYSDELGKVLHYLYEKYGLDPLGVFAKKGSSGNFDEDRLLNFNDIISNKEKIDSYIGSLGVNESDYEEENRLFLSVLEPLIKLRKETDGEVKDKLGDLYQKFLDIINGKRYKKVDIEPIVNIMVPSLDEITSMVKTSKTEEIVKLIDETIKKLNSKDKPKISKKEKTAVLVTGDINLTDEDQEEINDFINGLKENPNDIKEEKINKNMKLNEEIERIKSLFTNERLYGNLINEVCDNEDDAKNFLQDKGYIIRKPDSKDLCLGAGTNLGVIYNKYLSNTKLKFQSPNTKSGDCVLGLYAKDKGSWDNNYFLVNLFDGVDGKVFNMYFKVTDTIACTKTISIGGENVNLIVSKKGIDTTKTPNEIGVGLTYVKLEGDWTIDSNGDVKLTNIFIVKLMDENKKGIKTFVDIPIIGEVDLTSNTGLSSEGVNSGNGEVLKDSSGNCTKIKDVLEEKLGVSFTSGISLDDLITKIIV